MNATETKFSEVIVANNTQNDLPTAWWIEIVASLKATGTLPEAIADIFVVRTVDAEDGLRFVLDPA